MDYSITTVDTADEALAAFKKAEEEEPYDLVITHWGHGEGWTPDGERIPAAEQLLMEAALRHTRGKKQAAAKLLGWGRNTLTRKLQKSLVTTPTATSRRLLRDR